MRKFLKGTFHGLLFAYVFWWTMTRDIEYIVTHIWLGG